MPLPSTPLPIGEEAQKGIVKYLDSALSMFTTSYNIRPQMEARDKEYYRTNDTTTAQARAKAANTAGDTKKMQNVVVPVVMPQVETALAELTETFFSDYPIFPTVAPPEFMDAATQMDALIGDNSVRTGWINELTQTLRDGLKYDLGAVEVVWEKRKIFNLAPPRSAASTQGTPLEAYYEGNYMKRLSPYNLILDTRVSPEQNHLKGEFAGYTEMLSRIALKKEMEDLNPIGTMNFRKALESAGPGDFTGDQTAPYYIPQVNPDALLPNESRREHNWLAWAGYEDGSNKQGIQYKNAYERTVLYARILPSDFKMEVANRNHVQIWKFIIINRSVVIYAERQTNAHNYLPIVICKPSNDGMEWQSKSFAENVVPYQQVASSLVNSGMESQRRKVYDRLFYDPSRINKADIDVISAVSRVAVKNSAYGKAINEAVYQVPYRDDGVAEVMTMSQQFAAMADIANGQNRVQQGQFQKGNKTRKEFDTVMHNASNRGRMRALGLEFSFFVPIKEIIKTNILQYQQPTKVFNETVDDPKKQVTEIDPGILRQAMMKFKLADGLMPVDKLVDTTLVGTIFSASQAMPQLDIEYDLMGMFLYSMRLQGANWMTAFKRTPEQQAARLKQMQQAAMASGNSQPPAPKPSEGQPQ